MSTYRVALLAYPRWYRQANGAEIVDTANELADGRWSARQSGALMVEGWRTRVRHTSGGSWRQAWASGVAVALVLVQLTSMATAIIIGFDDSVATTGSWSVASLLLVALPVVALTITTRWPTVLLAAAPMGAVLLSAKARDLPSSPWLMVALTQGPVVILAGAVAVVGDGRRAMSPVKAVGLLGLAVGAGLFLPVATVRVALGLVELVVLPLAGLALVWLDPRPLAAASTIWLLWTLSWVSVLVSPGLYDPVAYAAWTAVFIAGSLLALVAAAAVGRRSLRMAR